MKNIVKTSLILLLIIALTFTYGCNAVTDSSNDTTDGIYTEGVTENTGNGTLDETESGTVADIPTAEQLRKEFYGDSVPADSHYEALQRSERGEISGADKVPYQAPTVSVYRPEIDGMFIRNSEDYYIDDNTYVVVDAYGEEVFRIYRGGGYITLEEVAAYVYAFGDVPANYSHSKKTSPKNSIWGEYLRLNHSKFSGNTYKYPYEPELPNINGCGGDLQYYEIDIGTMGTDCDPAYRAQIYNDGNTITRGAARIVYARFDKNGNRITEPDEKYVFYTYNHYNDFQEYLNYYGGWGDIFGNVTGGGQISSKKNYNPTPYIQTYVGPLDIASDSSETANREISFILAMILPTDLYYSKKH